MTGGSGKRTVRPDLTIRWNGELWRPQNAVPDWVRPGARIRVRPNLFRGYLWTRLDGGYSVGERFVKESDWLPEGF